MVDSLCNCVSQHLDNAIVTMIHELTFQHATVDQQVVHIQQTNCWLRIVLQILWWTEKNQFETTD